MLAERPGLGDFIEYLVEKIFLLLWIIEVSREFSERANSLRRDLSKKLSNSMNFIVWVGVVEVVVIIRLLSVGKLSSVSSRAVGFV